MFVVVDDGGSALVKFCIFARHLLPCVCVCVCVHRMSSKNVCIFFALIFFICCRLFVSVYSFVLVVILLLLVVDGGVVAVAGRMVENKYPR